MRQQIATEQVGNSDRTRYGEWDCSPRE